MLKVEMIFQFHKGTIKTTIPKSWLELYIYFNSIKVRLKPFDEHLGIHDFQNFNSIKVRLKQYETKLIDKNKISIP